MRFNPFRPNSIVGPGMFSGRFEEIDTVEQCLFQTKHSNPQHFLIQGERGIGKSSLFLVVENLASGKWKHADNAHFNFLTISVDIGGAEDQIDLIRSIAKALKREIDLRDQVKKNAGAVWDFISNWEIMGVRYHKSTEAQADDARDLLVENFVKLAIDARIEIDGICILIDEADGPAESTKLGEFVKLFTERLSRRGCNKVVLGLAGLPTVIPKLRASHESSPRVFETLKLEPLEPAEREYVVNRGLEEALEINKTETKITKDALGVISDLSEGYPHFVQQFAYYAFAEDKDNEIDVHDVVRGAYKENGALMQLGSKYFDEMYFSRISSESYRKVLDTMAEYSDAWVSRRDLIQKSGIKETTINNALNTLKSKNIIVLDESRQGYYRLPTKSFAAWIKAINILRGRASRRGMDDIFS
ncbi:hypothetical protein MKK75_06140 [Methylobacterium sp. J-030]|uniref:hypothetical protein n=1 Tax=Methylobacterium sp. J-030 TaxID=2836627 RepID=UPI001FBB3CDA|nr:hypothetical protein [Methylobacterium sp. J-030]MCJ2068393.1 hypothetical protein [Methylobacterium sp. J-030]